MAPEWYSQWLRHEIKDKIDTLLGASLAAISSCSGPTFIFHTAQVTGMSDVTMDFDDYEGAIVARFGVALVGWTHAMWSCPSELPLEVGPLEELLDAVKTGRCYFRLLTPAEHMECIDACRQRLETRSRQHRRRRGRKATRGPAN